MRRIRAIRNCRQVQIFFITIVVLFFSSCSTPLKEITYLGGIETNKLYDYGSFPEDYRIKTNDHLYIRVITDNPLNASFLNLMGEQMSHMSSSVNMELFTFLVDERGMILYPFLGEIEVGNKTLQEVQMNLQESVDHFLENASVFVKLVSRSITVLGEVSNPGQLPMLKTRLTIFEALGMAGDITDYGNRQNIKVIRELPEGRYFAEIDLTDPVLIDSPYYYILPHDIIYVEHRTRVYGAKNLGYATPLSIGASIVSVGLLILNLFK